MGDRLGLGNSTMESMARARRYQRPRHWRVRERVEEDAGNPEGVFTRVQMFYQVQLQVYKTNVMKVNLYSHANDN